MPSKSRDRQLAKLAARRQAERRASQRRRRLAAGIVGGIVGLVAIAVGLSLLFGGDTTTAASSTPTETPSTSHGKPTKTGTVTLQAQLPKKVACGAKRPAAADTPKPQFDHAPTAKQVLDTGATYTAVMKTSCGSVSIELDTKDAPQTVASFVFLARQHYFDGIPFHRIDSTISVIQGGDPTGTGQGGPGYTIADELTGTKTYTPGTLAMANTGQPNTGGSQFFLIYGSNGTKLDATPTYAIFGHATAGLDVLKRIAKIPVQDPSAGLSGQMPSLAVLIDSVTIKEQKPPPGSATPTTGISATVSPKPSG
jgi:cyclophilin family peptidyl-prolyl cis-trans isomerase